MAKAGVINAKFLNQVCILGQNPRNQNYHVVLPNPRTHNLSVLVHRHTAIELPKIPHYQLPILWQASQMGV